ncbi:MAG TPA: hypothetical protein ENG85_03915 [Bacteroidetes bacterium]|nr:hypothetical protein [Bacteroidota bacterium]
MTKKIKNSMREQEVSVEQKLTALYSLQQIDSQIDKIKIVRGELPLEVEDLEDEIAGLETRIANFQEEKDKFEQFITEKNESIIESNALIKKYTEQKMNVRNNREYDSLTKEIEFQNLEIQLSEKKIKEAKFRIDGIVADMKDASEKLEMRQQDLAAKKSELTGIIAETEKEEDDLVKKSQQNEELIEERLLTAYKRIRTNARNGLAVVQIERDACGGCFNKIPPQHQLDIKLHKKIIVCEYCGRILVDEDIAKKYAQENEKE